MTLRELIYEGAIYIIALTAIGAILHPRVHTGIIGSTALGGVAVFMVMGIEYEVGNWRLGQVVSTAALCLWIAARFWWHRSRIKRRLRQVVCERCPLHEDQ